MAEARQSADKPRQTIYYCSQCGKPVQLSFLEGDQRWRHVCSSCSHIHYMNPRNVVGGGKQRPVVGTGLAAGQMHDGGTLAPPPRLLAWPASPAS